jgi:hypothetical protein
MTGILVESLPAIKMDMGIISWQMNAGCRIYPLIYAW